MQQYLIYQDKKARTRRANDQQIRGFRLATRECDEPIHLLFQIKTIQVHDFIPSFDEVLDKLALAIVAGVNLRHGA